MCIRDRSRHVEIEHGALPCVGRYFNLGVIVAVSHHDRSAARQSIIEHRGVVNYEGAEIPVVQELGAEVDLRLEIGLVAIIIELLLPAAKDHRIAIPASRSRPLTTHVRIHPLVIGAIQEGQVVHLETGATPVLGCLPKPVPGVLSYSGVKAIALKRCSVGIVLGTEDSVAGYATVWTLEVMRAGLLGQIDDG